MNHSYELFIPTTKHNVPAPADLVEAIRVEVKKALAATFGGYTEYTANGGFVSESGDLIEEPVYVIEACYEAENDAIVWSLAATIKASLHQEAVMIRKDHEVHFV